MAEPTSALTHWILAAVEANPWLGYGAIALVMLLENVVPPIPSEVVLAVLAVVLLLWRRRR